MLASYSLSSTLVPVLSAWLLREREEEITAIVLPEDTGYLSTIGRMPLRVRWPWWLATRGCRDWHSFGGSRLGTDIFPAVDTGPVQCGCVAPTGTRVERTEVLALQALEAIRAEAGPANVAITLGFVGTQPPSYPINTIYLWTSGRTKPSCIVALQHTRTFARRLQRALRHKLPPLFPEGHHALV